MTEKVAARTLALPFYNRLSESDQDLVVKVLKDAMRHGDRYREFMIKASYLLRSLKTLSQWSASRKDAFKEPEVILSQARINDSME